MKPRHALRVAPLALLALLGIAATALFACAQDVASSEPRGATSARDSDCVGCRDDGPPPFYGYGYDYGGI